MSLLSTTNVTFGQFYTGVLALLILWVLLSASNLNIWKLLLVSGAGIVGPPFLYLFAASEKASDKPTSSLSSARLVAIPARIATSSPVSEKRQENQRGSSQNSHQRRTSQTSNSSRDEPSPTLISFDSNTSSGSKGLKKIWRRSSTDGGGSASTPPRPSIDSVAALPTARHESYDGSTHFRPTCRHCRILGNSVKRPGNKLANFANNTRRVMCPFHQQQAQVENIAESKSGPGADVMQRSTSLISSRSSSSTRLDDTNEQVQTTHVPSIDHLLAPQATAKPKNNIFGRKSRCLERVRRFSAPSDRERPKLSPQPSMNSSESSVLSHRKSLRLPKLFGGSKRQSSQSLQAPSMEAVAMSSVATGV